MTLHGDLYQHIEPNRRRMVNAIWRIVRDPDDTEDVLQQVLTRVIRREAKVRRHPNPSALIMRMCVNAALDQLRRSRKKTVVHNSNVDLDSIASRRGDPAEAVAAEETRRRILGAFSGLPKREAEAMSLRVLAEQSYTETAAAMGCREATIRVLVGRARKRLRAQFQGMGIPVPEERQ